MLKERSRNRVSEKKTNSFLVFEYREMGGDEGTTSQERSKSDSRMRQKALELARTFTWSLYAWEE